MHVLTLTATPIPRTLQLALTGVRELSLIATPPVDRLAVRTFISPFDPLVIREALLRENYRGGQSFYVVPAHRRPRRDRRSSCAQQVPEVKVVVAHGQMPPGELDDIMNAFYDGQYDVLLSTTIVESGLDIPTANTLIVHRADMFGLAQLYQLRGRVGRSKPRAYALFTLPAEPQADRHRRAAAEGAAVARHARRRLPAGQPRPRHPRRRQPARRGAVRPHQGGRLRALPADAGGGGRRAQAAAGEAADGGWSPQITIGTAVMIPEELCARPAAAPGALPPPRRPRRRTEEIEAFAAELIDRFGPLPDEVEQLLKIVFIKALCRQANVEKVDAGPKGVVIHFRKREFADPAGLVRYIGEQGSLAKIRPDQSVVFMRDWPTPKSACRRRGGDDATGAAGGEGGA